ncbi:MAG: hypothetical protein M1838_006100 [Thelocarpon superellum]|nr:MAG: hypothetical protein M1838_006100 [Thelocarpon superellum]
MLATRNDTSTIDYAYMPEPPAPPTPREWIAVPFLPDNFAPMRDPGAAEVMDTAVMRPQISTAALESTHVHAPSAMSEVTDNAAMKIDPYELTKTVNGAAAEALSKLQGKGAATLRAIKDGDEEPSVFKEIWDGFLDDLLGTRAKARSA